MLLGHQDGTHSLTLDLLLFGHVSKFDDCPAGGIIPNRRDAVFNVRKAVSDQQARSCGLLTVVMTILVYKYLWFILHCNSLLLLGVHWALVYRVWISVGTTAVNSCVECVLIDFLIRKPGNLFGCDTSERWQRRNWLKLPAAFMKIQ